MNTQTRTHFARAALLVILLVLCYRMTINEGIDDGFIGTLSTQLSGLPVAVEISCAAALVLLCSGIGLLVETPRRWPLWAGLFAITGMSVAAFTDAFWAANNFAALVGACDFSMNLLAGWTIALLCNSPNRRALAISVLATLGAVLAFKGLYQHFVEIPQTITQFSHHPNRWLASIGIRPGSPAVRLFISRLKSREVSGFGSDNDQFGEALIPLIMLNLMLALSWYYWVRHLPASGGAEPRKATRTQRSEANATRNTLVIGSIFAGIVLLAEFCVLYFTRSKGSIAATVLGAGALLAGLAGATYVQRLRHRLFWLLVLFAAIGAGALVAYGLAFHGLPTKDLLFRWQYWNGAMGIIVHHLWHGVGLNNFGYYYTRYKWPSAPEDVKDPHNIFVRIAAELGIPAVLIFILLIGLWFYRVFCPPADSHQRHQTPPMVLILGFACLWWMGNGLSRSIGAGRAIPYILELSVVYAAIAIVAMAVMCQLFTCISHQYRRKIEIALAVGAAGMLLYDQINLALVTGCVAMLFWVVLALAQPLEGQPALAVSIDSSHAGADRSSSKRSASQHAANLQPSGAISGTASTQGRPAASASWKDILARIWGAGLVAASLALVVGVITPVVSGHFAWDTKAYAAQYKKDMVDGHLHRALVDIDHILRFNRRSPAWLERKITVMEELGQNPRNVTLLLLHLNTADARVRIPLAMTPASGLTLPERIAELKLAVRLNDELPKTEVTRISVKHIASLKAMIRVLESQLKQKSR